MEKLANGLYQTETVPEGALTVEFFERHIEEAKQLGLTHWGTVTNKDESPWVTKIVFYNRENA